MRRAQDDDVEVARAVNAEGDEASVDAVFEAMRRKLRGEHAQTSVKEEPWEEVTVEVDALRFTQLSCKSVFSCGRPIEQAVISDASEFTLLPKVF